MNNQPHFGKWLKREIENRELSQVAFCELADIPRPTLVRWLPLAAPPIRGVNIARLARALGVTREEVEAKLAEAQAALATAA